MTPREALMGLAGLLAVVHRTHVILEGDNPNVMSAALAHAVVCGIRLGVNHPEYAAALCSVPELEDVWTDTALQHVLIMFPIMNILEEK